MLGAAGLVAVIPLHALWHRVAVMEKIAPKQRGHAQADQNAAAAEHAEHCCEAHLPGSHRIGPVIRAFRHSGLVHLEMHG